MTDQDRERTDRAGGGYAEPAEEIAGGDEPTLPDRRERQPAEAASPESTVTPEPEAAAASVSTPTASEAPIDGEQLNAAILRFLRRYPNQTVNLAPLADELGVDPFRMQLAVEDLHRRRMVVAPFIEPGTAGGATLSEVGLRWLIEREGGTPADRPVALQPATERVRPEDEAARLPRAQVYGTSGATRR